MYLMGIDLGSSSVKVGIFSEDGEEIGISRQTYPLERPLPSWAEQDPNIWWRKVCEAIRQVLSKTDVDPARIAGIGVCGQGAGPVLVDKRGDTLGKCIVWSDKRCVDQAKRVRDRLGSQYSNLAFSAERILWLKEQRPEVFAKAWMFLLPTGYIVYKLTGQTVTDYTNASETGLCIPTGGVWSDTVLDEYGISHEQLPKIHSPWEVIGEVTRNAELETGLKEGISVIAGCGDWACAQYGAGYVKPGRTVEITGTTLDLSVAGKAERPQKGNIILPDLVATSNVVIRTGGSLYRWFANLVYGTDNARSKSSLFDELRLMEREAGLSGPGLLLIPTFSGDRDTDVVLGCGTITGLTLETTRGQLARAVMEGLAFEMKRRISLQGIPDEVAEIRTIGGTSSNKVWTQIKADIFGIPFCQIDRIEAGCTGAAVLAGVGVGIYSDLVSPIEDLVHVVARMRPQEEHQELYSELYETYCWLVELLASSGFDQAYDTARENATKLALHLKDNDLSQEPGMHPEISP